MNASAKLQIGEPLLQWLDSLPHSMPLRVREFNKEKSSSLRSVDDSNSPLIDEQRLGQFLENSRLPTDSLITAMLWLRIGVIDKSHEIVQEGRTPIASYLHGIVHRMEGDFWNSKYWFKQVRDIRLLGPLSDLMERSLKDQSLSTTAASLKIMQGNVFVPEELVSACEKLSQLSQPNSESVVALERMTMRRCSFSRVGSEKRTMQVGSDVS
ncbi:MAG TPA: hypothetical protein VM260_22610 [Pirellula sp.]|nr:hypothetical protein [Pirellula sp.]